MVVKTVRVREFLANSNSPVSDPLPLVHTTKYRFIFSIMEKLELTPTDCNVFVGEKILYCFVGRPSFKWDSTSEAKKWQLPVSFVFERPPEIAFNRVIPFDSGSFSELLPKYISDFPIADYFVDSDARSIGKLISVFFRTNDRYFRGLPVSGEEFEREHSLLPRHQEISALVELYNDRNYQLADERKSTIEMQTADTIALRRGSLLGVVLPSDLKREPELISQILNLGAKAHFYEEYPIKAQHYTYEVYNSVRNILIECGKL